MLAITISLCPQVRLANMLSGWPAKARRVRLPTPFPNFPR